MTAQRISFLLLLLPMLSAAATAAASSHFYTWPGWEPDKGATAWYWLRFVDRQARIEVLPAGTTHAPGKQAQATFFDTPTAAFRRTQNSSTMESVLRAHPTRDAAILKLAQLTRDIEINAWRPRVHPESVTLEAAFRKLQQRWPDVDPPVPCIIEFFDRVHTWLTAGGALQEGASVACKGASPKEGAS